MNFSAAEFKLLRGAHLYVPADLGVQDVLIARGKIIAIAPAIPNDVVPDCEVIELHGQLLCPGLIDQHIHLIGGGGEAGPTTRTPEVGLSRLVEAGITTAIGLLGTDAVTRHPESLLAKTRALNEEGITAYMLTGAYRLPSPTITGSVERDVALIDRVIGVKCAVSDHRSSAADESVLANMAAQARVGGLLGGKAGISVFHMGSSSKLLEPLYRILENSDVPIGKLLPTHVNRSEDLFEAALLFALQGGHIDITSGISQPIAPAQAIDRARKSGVKMSQLTVSSDGNGSQPVFDAKGNLSGIGVAGFTSLLETLVALVQQYGYPLTEALQPFTCSVAAFLGLEGKGEIAIGKDADFMVLTPELTIERVYAGGRIMVAEGKACVKGTFE